MRLFSFNASSRLLRGLQLDTVDFGHSSAVIKLLAFATSRIQAQASSDSVDPASKVMVRFVSADDMCDAGMLMVLV